MDKNNQEIMVVGREFLFDGDHFEGFSPAEKIDFEARILKHYEYMRRGDAEQNPRFKQPTAYAALVNPDRQLVFAYQRSEQHDEKRLAGRYSWGLGGHIERVDLKGNPIRTSRTRELGDEVEIVGSLKDIITLGYVNDDSTEVGKVHFGILYVVETDATEVKPKDPEIAFGGMKPVEYLDELCSMAVVIEPWSLIALEPLKKHLSR